jgi:hypothetical protein
MGMSVGYPEVQYLSDPQTLPYADWLSYFQDVLLADLPMIPASHDSAAVRVADSEDWLGLVAWLYAQTQSSNILNQLLMGVRLLDLRLWVTYDAFDMEDSIDLSHTFRSNLTLSNTLAQVKQFLKAHPTEFVILMTRIDSEHPLTSQRERKQQFVEETFLGSGLEIANVTTTLRTVTVGELAGKVIVMAPGGTVFPSSSKIPFIDRDTQFTVCDIYKFSSIYSAKERMATCFPTVSPSLTESGIMSGYALDGHFDQLWPNLTSPEMNNWWIYNFQNNPLWVQRKLLPVGIMMIDFCEPKYMSVQIDYIMNFGYPYPYMGSKEPWKPGAAIFVNGAGLASVGLALILSIISTT